MGTFACDSEEALDIQINMFPLIGSYGPFTSLVVRLTRTFVLLGTLYGDCISFVIG